MSSKTKKESYAVAVSVTAKKIIVQKGDVVIEAQITEGHIGLSGQGHREFVFRSSNNAATIKRWENVIGAMQVALEEIKKERKL